MILAIILGYWIVGAIFWQLFGKKYTKISDVLWWYPIGFSISGLYFFAAWLSELPFIFFVYFWWIAVLFSAVWIIKSHDFQTITTSILQKMQRSEISINSLNWWQWPLLFYTAAIGLSLFVVTFWQIFLHPVGWDSVALYDFRALRIAEGWNAHNFMMQFLQIPDYRAYDFLHPMTTSLWWAHAYISGASHILFLYTTLLANVIFLGWSIWKERASQITWAFLWLGFPAVFVSLTEGYGVYPATLFTVLAVLWWTVTSDRATQNLTLSDWSVFSLFVLGSTQGRITEYFWVILMLWTVVFLTMKSVKIKSVLYFKSIYAVLVLPLIHLFWWFALRSQAVVVSGSFDADRSISSLVMALQSLSVHELVIAVQKEFLSWIMNPAVIWLVLSAVGIFWLIRVKKQKRAYWFWLILLVGMLLATLYAGMVVMHVVFADRWIEAKQAMDRASMPILAICFILLTDISEHMAQVWANDSSKNMIS